MKLLTKFAIPAWHGRQAWLVPSHRLPLRCLLADDGVGRLPQVHLPVRLRDLLVCSERVPTRHEENAVSPTAVCSRRRTGPVPGPRTHCCTLQASHISRALLRFLRDFSASLRASWGGRARPSFLHTVDNTWQICKQNSERDGQAVRQHSEVTSVHSIFTDLPSPRCPTLTPMLPQQEVGLCPSPRCPTLTPTLLRREAGLWPSCQEEPAAGSAAGGSPGPTAPPAGLLRAAGRSHRGWSRHSAGRHLCTRSHKRCSWQSCGLQARLLHRQLGVPILLLKSLPLQPKGILLPCY